MGKLVTPKVFLIGCSTIDTIGLYEYLKHTNNLEFSEVVEAARNNGISAAECLCSFMGKLCYKSLTVGQNANISRTRDIEKNLEACFDSGHGSVFEHVVFNLVVTDCSRVFTHELVRHRVGTAFSQTSGRYVRPIDENGNGVLDFVMDPILEPVKSEVLSVLEFLEDVYKQMVYRMGVDDMKDFSKKKKITSALRRILPNGQSNEMGFSINLRSVRHLMMVRTSRHAEWEIRVIFEQIYHLLKTKFPMVFYGATEEIIEGIVEVSGMTLQPYEKNLSKYSVEELHQELDDREGSHHEQDQKG